MSGRITEKFRELVEYRWSEFVAMDTDVNGSNFDSIVGALVRACKKGNLRAIQVALDRLDGKIATEIEVEYPKFYTVYPQAIKTADDVSIIELLPEPTEVKLREVSIDNEEPLTGGRGSDGRFPRHRGFTRTTRGRRGAAWRAVIEHQGTRQAVV